MQEKFDRLFLKALPELRRYGYTLLISRHINSNQMNINDMINNVYLDLRKSSEKNPLKLENSSESEFKGACMKYMKFRLKTYFNPMERENRTLGFSRLLTTTVVGESISGFEDFADSKMHNIVEDTLDEKRLTNLINSYSDKVAIEIFLLRQQGYTNEEVSIILKLTNKETINKLYSIKQYLKKKLSKTVNPPRISIVLTTNNQNLKRDIKKAAILDLVKKGYPPLEIANRLNLSRSSVYHYVNPKEFKKLKKPEKSIDLINRQITGLSIGEAVKKALTITSSVTEIANLVGISKSTVRLYKRKLNGEN
jgi:DNA-binding CsgD family transcriptional regulator